MITEQTATVKTPNLENVDQAFYNSEILIAEENPCCDRWGDWNTVYAAGEELQPRQRLQIRVSENFMILCYSNSKSRLNLAMQTWRAGAFTFYFFNVSPFISLYGRFMER